MKKVGARNNGRRGANLQLYRNIIHFEERTWQCVALVTGGMGGLGESICIKLAALGLQGGHHPFAGQRQGGRMAADHEQHGLRLQGLSLRRR